MGGCLGVSKKSGPIFDDNYEIIGDELGHGAYAVVHKCIRRSDNKDMAVKIVDRQKLAGEDEDALQDEISILKSSAFLLVWL